MRRRRRERRVGLGWMKERGGDGPTFRSYEGEMEWRQRSIRLPHSYILCVCVRVMSCCLCVVCFYGYPRCRHLLFCVCPRLFLVLVFLFVVIIIMQDMHTHANSSSMCRGTLHMYTFGLTISGLSLLCIYICCDDGLVCVDGIAVSSSVV